MNVIIYIHGDRVNNVFLNYGPRTDRQTGEDGRTLQRYNVCSTYTRKPKTIEIKVLYNLRQSQ